MEMPTLPCWRECQDMAVEHDDAGDVKFLLPSLF